MAWIDRNRLFNILGYAGFTLCVVTAIAYGIMPEKIQYIWIGWLIGGPGVMAYVVGNFETVKTYLKRRSARYGANAAVLVMLFLGVLVFVEAISAIHYLQFDLTANKYYTLSDQTIRLLQGLTEPVHVTAFFQEAARTREEAKDLLSQYANVSRRFTFEFVDPDRFPGKARRYKVTTYGTIVLECGTRDQKVTELSEEKLTNALLRLIRKGEKVVYFLSGHGEKSIEDRKKGGYSTVKEAIQDQNYAVKELLLMRAHEVPEDAAVLIVPGPQKPLFPIELEMLEGFIDRGGHIFILLDPETQTGLEKFLKEYGIEVGNDIIIDKLSRLFGGDYLTPIVSKYALNHPITKNFNTASFFPVARSVAPADIDDPEVETTRLAFTGESSWAETDLEKLEKGRASFDEEKDKRGPVPVAVVSTVKIDKSKKGKEEEKNKEEGGNKSVSVHARIVVFGDSDFASNSYLNLSGNRDLFLNTLSWLAEEEDLISIRPKKRENTPVVLSYTQGRVIFWSSVILLPGVVLVIGIIVFRSKGS
nr:hypothetical protein [Desulfobacterales bacterium]